MSHQRKPLSCVSCGLATANLGKECSYCLRRQKCDAGNVKFFDEGITKTRVLMVPAENGSLRVRAGGGFRVMAKKAGE